MNISGNAGTWLTAEKKQNEVVEKVVKRKPVNITKELKSLKDLHDKLDIKHKETSNKDLNDALISIDAAIRAIKNIKN
ncbi:MAG: hypothetical protein ACOC22_01585 [bacterium]